VPSGEKNVNLKGASPGIYCSAGCWNSPDILEEHVASIFRVEE
jgi:hypothetical protein